MNDFVDEAVMGAGAGAGAGAAGADVASSDG